MVSWVFPSKMVPNHMSVCIDHTDSFELDLFDEYFNFIFWLKLNNENLPDNDTVFEASVLEYDRYRPPRGPRSCHRYLEL